MRKIVILALVLSFFPVDSLGKSVPSAFVCDFSSGTSTNFQSGLPKTQDDTLGVLTLAGIDTKQRTAQLVGNAGASQLVLLPGEATLNFVESTGSGNLTLTTVFMAPVGDGRFPAVHSRHIAVGRIPSVSQFPGLCAARW